MKTCVLAIDPGFITGAAWHRIWAGRDADKDEFGCTQLDRTEFGIWLDFEISYKGSIDLVVVEQFNVTRMTPPAFANHALEVIGQVKLICQEHDVPVLLQTRQTGKNLGTNERLKKLGWHRTQLTHATDAARHLLAYRLAEGWTNQALDQPSNSV